MINLRNSPFLWLALLLILSFTLEDLITSIPFNWLSFLIGLLMLASLYGSVLKYNPAWKYFSTISISSFVFLSGIWRQQQFEREQFPDPLYVQSVWMEGTLTIQQVLKSKETSISLRCKVNTLETKRDTSPIPFTDRFLLFQIRNPVDRNLLPGDQIIFKGYVSPIPPPFNPYAFDARVYYKTIGIRYQAFSKGEETEILPSKKFSINRLTAKWQSILSNKVRSHTTPQVAQVINALVWGDRSDMDADVRDAFADSGAMHVLSVSGMHVAMIYSILLLFFGKPGDGVLVKRILRFICYASAIMLYVALTGACPAVFRAGLMILLFLFGKAMGWNTQIWNLLGFAAFVMLWMNPYVYHNVGFQLSFLALAGILLFAKPIIRSLSFQSKILHWTWEIVALSLAAQVFIVPILLRQFHQFPLTFIISSIVAIPAGYIIIVGALINVPLSFIGVDFLWKPLDWSAVYFIKSMKWMAELNPAMNYSMTPAAGWMIFLMSIVFSAALVYRWPRGKYAAYGFGVISILMLTAHRNTEWKGKELIIYHTFQGLLIDITVQGYCYELVQGDLAADKKEFAARGNRCERDIIGLQSIPLNQNVSTHDFILKNNLLVFYNYSFFILRGPSGDEKEQGDFTHLIITNLDSIWITKKFICNHPESTVILPASLNRKAKNKLLYFLKENEIKYDDIAESGYLRLVP